MERLVEVRKNERIECVEEDKEEMSSRECSVSAIAATSLWINLLKPQQFLSPQPQGPPIIESSSKAPETVRRITAMQSRLHDVALIYHTLHQETEE